MVQSSLYLESTVLNSYLYTCVTSLCSRRDYCADGNFLATQLPPNVHAVSLTKTIALAR